MNISLSSFAPETLISRDGFGRPVPRQPACSPHSGWTWRLLPGFLPIFATAPIYLHRQPPSGQSQVFQAMRLRTDGDGVHCRECGGTGPAVVLTQDSFSNGCSLFRHHHGSINVRLSSPPPTIGMHAMYYYSCRNLCSITSIL